MSEPASPPEREASEALRAGREALGRHAWQEAFGLLSRADGEGELAGEDLEALAEAAFFAAHAERGTEVKERAFKAYLAKGNLVRAAYIALDVARQYGYMGKSSIASAWTRRAGRLLDGQAESYAHGYLALIQSDDAKAAGNIDAALELAEQGVQIAARTAYPDLQATALTTLGTLKIATGATSDGFALMEEASIAAVNGELSPFTTGVTTCTMIAACRDLTDYRRASEWTEATERYCERQSVSGFPGVCRVHRAEIVALGGAWDRAEQELERATGELAGYNAIPPLADGYYAIGEIRRLKGDLAGAEASLRQAHGLGRTPHPALALIRLAQGNVKAAAMAISSALNEETWDQWARARLLPAQVEIAIAAADHGLARDAAAELSRIVATYKSPALEAGKQQAWGRVQTRMTFMFTDIAGSTNLAELLGNEAWERLLSWHDDTLRGLVAKHGGEIVNPTGDGFFMAFDSAQRAIECALSIQRALADHRPSGDIALSVRIGLHTAEANRRGADYSGVGVHLAARVAALANGGEVLATADTLAEAGDVATIDPREAALKGVRAPVSVASVTWT